ncbi:hypothetical protein BG011_002249 [Mortierella polycephala]|uniref:Uncharacterized protein n=1 Tax=Mortierella polycephala TaxID=41804 RepID=A0A9P6PJ39_9FUNG|nr:hypothetical protein BG011_002249 [Mortierella polycephala]
MTPTEPGNVPTLQVLVVSITNDEQPIPTPEGTTKENEIRDAPSEDPTPIPQGKQKHDYPNPPEHNPQTAMQNHGDDCLATTKRIIGDMDIGLERYVCEMITTKAKQFEHGQEEGTSPNPTKTARTIKTILKKYYQLKQDRREMYNFGCWLRDRQKAQGSLSREMVDPSPTLHGPGKHKASALLGNNGSDDDRYYKAVCFDKGTFVKEPSTSRPWKDEEPMSSERSLEL